MQEEEGFFWKDEEIHGRQKQRTKKELVFQSTNVQTQQQFSCTGTGNSNNYIQYNSSNSNNISTSEEVQERKKVSSMYEVKRTMTLTHLYVDRVSVIPSLSLLLQRQRRQQRKRCNCNYQFFIFILDASSLCFVLLPYSLSTIQDNNMDNINDPARPFIFYGLRLINGNRPSVDTRWNTVNQGRWQSNFGVSPKTCHYLWDALSEEGSLPKKTEFFHLLWTLLFLKVYMTEKVMSSMIGVDEKTYRKWVRAVLPAIAGLKERFVSFFSFFFTFVFKIK